MSGERVVALTRSQTACLRAMASAGSAVAEIAVATKLGRFALARALSALEVAGLAEQNDELRWRATLRGREVGFARSKSARPLREAALSQNARRLLELLETPIEGRRIAKRLGISRQGAVDIVRRLQAQGYLKIVDAQDPFWMVQRTDDDTPLLDREEARVLSAAPGDYATNPWKMARRTRLPLDRVEKGLDRLVQSGLVEAVGEFNGEPLYRATAAGLAHFQNSGDIRCAEPPHLPVYSDRVRSVLSAIETAGALRIRDVRDQLSLPQKSINGLMQYLKGKKLVHKADDSFEAPYVLSVMGRLTLAEMTQPGHLRSGYEKGAMEPTASPRARGLAAVGEFGGPTSYGSRSEGASNSRNRKKVSAPPQPRLPVHSQRIQAVLTAIASAGALRAKEAADALQLQPQSVNALMQYLKGKGLVEKTGAKLADPYALTEAGRATLAGMEQLRAA